MLTDPLWDVLYGPAVPLQDAPPPSPPSDLPEPAPGPQEATQALPAFDRERLSALDRALVWKPQPGPQLDAYLSKADVTLYGGAAGGGKTDLAVGLALTAHRSTLIVRREGTQLVPVIDRIAEIVGDREGLNASIGVWRLPGGRVIRLGGVPNPGDEARFQGHPRDLLVIDEAANVLEQQVRFLMAWVRSSDPRQRCRTLLCSNPPTSAEGEWIVRMFAPWLDPTHPVPARPGELRWCAMIPGEGERWVDGPAPFTHKGESIKPLSRTFIPSRIADNAYLRGTGYLTQLQALPEPLRSQMLNGDFNAGRQDDEWQVIPSAWIRAAMDRWTPTDTAGEITSIGVDPSRGSDEATIALRRGWRFDPLILVSPDSSGLVTGGAIAKRVIDVAGDAAPIHVDPIGVGASALDHLEAFVGRRVVPVNGALPSEETDVTGSLTFANVRAAIHWNLRQRLDPANPVKVALPKDQRLFADLAAPRYRVTARGIQVEDKAEIKRRLGRSPDRGDAVILAAIRTPVFFDHRSGRRITIVRAARSVREER